jgi:hypothetical protein
MKGALNSLPIGSTRREESEAQSAWVTGHSLGCGLSRWGQGFTGPSVMRSLGRDGEVVLEGLCREGDGPWPQRPSLLTK